jgi:peptidoglycan hydrolase CwlO-like protein
MFSGKEKTMNSQKNLSNHNRPRSPVSSAGLSFWAVVVCLATLLSLASSTVAQDEWLGVAGGPPDKDPNKHADKINQKLDKVHGNLEKLLNTAIASDQIFDSNQVQYFKNQKDRSKKNKDRFHKQGGFKQVGKKKNFKNNKDEYDPNEFEDFESAIDDLNDILVDANTELSNGNHAKALYMALAKSHHPDKCQEFSLLTTILGGSAALTRGLTILASTAYDATDAFAQQTVWGTNASSFSAVFAIAAGVLDGIATGLEIADEWVSADLQSACLNQIDDTVYDINETVTDIENVTAGTLEDVNDLAKAVDRLNSALFILTETIEDINDLINLRFSEQNELLNTRFDTVEALLNTRFDDVEILLNTPHGRRPGLPK